MRPSGRTTLTELPGCRGTAGCFRDAAEVTRRKQGEHELAGLLKAVFWIGAVVLLLTYFSAPAGAASGQTLSLGRANVSGLVPDGEPASAVTVQLQSFTGTIVQTAHTDDSGHFSFHGVPPGDYVIVVRVPGYHTVKRFVSVGSDNVRGLELLLSPVKFGGTSGETRSNGSSVVSVRQLQIPAKARKEFRKGNKSRARGKIEEAIKHWQKSIEIYPKYAESYMQLSRVYANRGDFDRATTAAERAVEIDGNSAAAYSYLGFAYLKEKEFPKAESAFQNAVRLSDSDWFSQFWLGELLLKQKNPKGAYPHLLRASTLNPGMRDVFVLLYDDLLKLGRRKEALAELDDFLARFPNDPLAKKARVERNHLARSLDGK